MSTIHEQFDIARWKHEFPLALLREEAKRRFDPAARAANHRLAKEILGVEIEPSDDNKILGPGGERIVGPYDLAIVEQVREEALAGVDRSKLKPAPTDVFVFGVGEPSRPELTKIGGVPYRPANKPWPSTRSGDPMTFVAQFCFADSRDIAGDLPGEVLLMFADPGLNYGYDRTDLCHFEWHDLGIAEPVHETLPKTEWIVNPRYGQIFRTHDYLDAASYFSRYDQSYVLDNIEGTKIGGAPRWVQYEENLPGRFLCALGSVASLSNRSYPYVNVPDPLGYEQDGLMWGDVGSVYFFLNDQGIVHWAMQSY